MSCAGCNLVKRASKARPAAIISASGNYSVACSYMRRNKCRTRNVPKQTPPDPWKGRKIRRRRNTSTSRGVARGASEDAPLQVRKTEAALGPGALGRRPLPGPGTRRRSLTDCPAPSVSSACGAHDEADGGGQSSPDGGGAAGRCPAPAPRVDALQAVQKGQGGLHGGVVGRCRAEADEGLRRGPSRRRPSRRRSDGDASSSFVVPENVACARNDATYASIPSPCAR